MSALQPIWDRYRPPAILGNPRRVMLAMACNEIVAFIKPLNIGLYEAGFRPELLS